MIAVSVVAGVLALATTARAHDGPPEPFSLHERGDDPDAGRIMATTFGLLRTVDGTAWEVMCSEAIGYDEKLDAAIHWSANGTFFVGSQKGLFISRDGGCTWAPHASFSSRGASDIEGLPGQPSSVLVTTGRPFADANGLFRSDDDGFTFTQVLGRPDTLFTGIRFAPSDVMRAYVSAWDANTSAAVLYRSDDAGGTFFETAPSVPSGQGFTLVAISPRDSGELYASAYDGSSYLLLRSTDDGATFTEVARDEKAFKQLAFTAGGQTIYASANRLFRSTDAGATFTKTLAPKRSACVEALADQSVEACASPLLDPYVLGRIESDGGVTPTFAFGQVRGIVSCPDGTQVHDTCSKIWPALSLLLGVPSPGQDAGMELSDGGSDVRPPNQDAGDSAPAPSATGCGCDASGGGQIPFAAMLILVAFSLRRRPPAHTERSERSERSRSVVEPGRGSTRLRLRRFAATLSPNGSAHTERSERSERSRNVLEPGRGFTRLRLRRFAATLSPNGAAVVALALGTLLLACSHPPSTPASDAGLDPCTPNPCTTPHRTACSTKDAHPVCVCEPGFNDVAGTCVDADPCTPNPCTAPHKTQCTLFGSAAACACDPGYVPDETGGCRMDVPVDCSAQHPDGDDFEPDECPALARDLGGSGEQEEPHTIAPADDADWFKVTASPGRIFRVRTSGAAVPLTAQAFTGDPLAQVGDAHGSAEGVNAAWKAPSAGTLYFRVRAQDPQATGPYAVSIGDLGPDDFGDDAASATEAGATDAIAGLLQFNGDVDVVKLPLAEGHAWEVSGDAPVLKRIDSSDSPRWTAKGTPIRTITRIASGESPALFRIRSDDPEALDLGWTLNLTDLGPDDVGDTPAEAELTAPGATISGSLERADDRDLFRFDAVAPHIYAVRCIPTGPGDCLLTLLDPAGTVIASDLDGSEGFVVHEFQDADTQVTVQVEASAGETFAYALSIEDRGVDDYPDEPPTEWDAGMPVPSLSGSGDIETPGDRDFIPFTADVNHIYRITCTRGTLADCLERVFNSNGIMVAADTDGDDALLLHEYNGGGQFYVDFSGGPGEVGTYDWLIEDLLHDDHGDDLFTATGMSANAAWVTGDLETPGDQDWFQLSALQGHVYRFTCQRLSLGDCYAALYDPTETLQLQDVDGQDALLLYEVGPAQNEYLRITAPGGEVGTYWVKAEDLGTDDCPDTAAGALPMLADGTAANGSFETPGDLDFRSLSLQQGTTYQLSATGTALAFTLYAPDATTVVASGGTPATFTPTQSGTHYLEVHALASSLTGAYSLSVHP